jgi:hypothetical protein
MNNNTPPDALIRALSELNESNITLTTSVGLLARLLEAVNDMAGALARWHQIVSQMPPGSSAMDAAFALERLMTPPDEPGVRAELYAAVRTADDFMREMAGDTDD